MTKTKKTKPLQRAYNDGSHSILTKALSEHIQATQKRKIGEDAIGHRIARVAKAAGYETASQMLRDVLSPKMQGTDRIKSAEWVSSPKVVIDEDVSMESLKGTGGIGGETSQQTSWVPTPAEVGLSSIKVTSFSVPDDCKVEGKAGPLRPPQLDNFHFETRRFSDAFGLSDVDNTSGGKEMAGHLLNQTIPVPVELFQTLSLLTGQLGSYLKNLPR